MTEKERREDEALKNCIQEAYGCSDDQLLAELDEIEASLSDSDFPGVEERIYEKLMERAEEEVIIILKNGNTVEKQKKNRKYNWKKVGLVAALVATFVGLLGVTAIGKKSYFLKRNEKRVETVLNSGANVYMVDSLEEAYKTVEKEMEIPVLKLNYMPKDLLFEQLSIINNKATFVFSYEDKKVYFIQEKEEKEISNSINSDRKSKGETVYNEWLSQEIEIEENKLENDEVEYSALVCISNVRYRFIGMLPAEDFFVIIEKLDF